MMPAARKCPPAARQPASTFPLKPATEIMFGVTPIGGERRDDRVGDARRNLVRDERERWHRRRSGCLPPRGDNAASVPTGGVRGKPRGLCEMRGER